MAGSTLTAGDRTSDSRLLDCATVFRPDVTADDLVRMFGPAAVRTGQIDVGEGMRETGTILFGNSAVDRIEVVWREPSPMRRPQMVLLHGERSRWRMAHGITLGTDLRTLERLNGRPFRLLGFGWDWGGGVLSWSGGRLRLLDENPSCTIGLTLLPDSTRHRTRAYDQVGGEREFSLGHPAMQELNPSVYFIRLWFK